MRDGTTDRTKQVPAPGHARAVAALVLIAAAVLVFHFIVGLVVAVFWIVAIDRGDRAGLWAANELF